MIVSPGKTALVTGASSGIGEQFARQLAAKGVHLVLVARSEGKLHALARELAAAHRIDVAVIAADLSRPHAGTAVFAEVRRRGLTVDLLVNNAGFATHGPFERLPLERQRDEIMLNVVALVELTHAALPDLIAREGGVLNVASTAALQPDPYMAVYGATKAFVLSFSEALWAEVRGRGVTVTALCPGATQTAFFDVVNAEEASVGRRDTPENVVRAGLRALERGHGYVVPGAANYWLAQLNRFVPRRAAARLVERMLRPNAGPATPSPRRAG